MLTACEKCQTKHQLDLTGLDTWPVQYQCQKCGHLNKVANPAGDQSAKVAAAPLDLNLSPNLPKQQPSKPADLQKGEKPQISGLSIKTKLTLVLVGLVVSSLTIVGLVASTKSSEALSQQAREHLLLISGQKTKEYNNIFTRLQNEIEGVAIYAQQTFARTDITSNLGFRILMPWTGQGYGGSQMKATFASDILALQRIGIALQGLVEKNPFLELGYMATGDNLMVMDDEEIVGVIEAENGFVPTQRPWYLSAEETGRTIWTQPYIDVNTKKLIVSCATPVYRQDNSLIGVVGFDVLLDTLQKDIISLDIGYDSQAFLLSKTGDFLARPGMSRGGNSWSQAFRTGNALDTENGEFKAIVRKMMSGQRGIGTQMEQGQKIFVAYAPLPAIDASVGITVSYKEVMRPAREIQILIIGIWVVVLIVAVVIGLVIGNGITKPINDLSRRANLISLGKMDLEEFSESRKDEIGVLIEAFNRLVTSLKIAMARTQK